MKKYLASLLSLLTLALPAIAFGQQLQNLSTLVGSATRILNQLVPFAIGLGLVVFLFGVVRYVTSGAGEEKAAARSLMIYGIIALFVAVSVWGLVRFIQESTGISGDQNINAPNLPTPNSSSNSSGNNSQSYGTIF